MLRHPVNANLSLHYGNRYEAFPIQEDKGPFVSQYLSRLYQTLKSALGQYSRVFAFRIDLRLPAEIELPDSAYTNEVIGRFIESFKAKIKHNRHKARQLNAYVHDSNVRFVWAREQGQHGKPHHHLVILLNYDAFNALGKFEPGRDNMFNRLVEAWASALGLPVEAVSGLVEIPSNPYYHLHRDDSVGQAEFFYRASYLCKSATKAFGDGHHGFGASRI
ncbi:inovirus Gp2 family protein [Pseudomonas sp. 6D_7.1_Bac1]|uniref:inovirus Gp2 family protein n=1 Tax=Pseudomonas sp. 6D_7.1_Bac1 TaxID=2971615 RepID=UPI0021C9AFDB|nr:inovirus Gp2 family protein [Pseudomonas sp. 6D_7.1_Bac1]MCU1748598.1 inovirus Gp2 family protein [Pseudomonas sp. 6D_7.1_Bac1]